MSKPPAFGEGAKGHRGRLLATSKLPVHLEGFHPTSLPMKYSLLVLAAHLTAANFAGSMLLTTNESTLRASGRELSTTPARQSSRTAYIRRGR